MKLLLADAWFLTGAMIYELGTSNSQQLLLGSFGVCICHHMSINVHKTSQTYTCIYNLYVYDLYIYICVCVCDY